MADEKEVVEYEFTCDNSGLINGVDQGIDSMKRMSHTALEVVKATDFSPIQKSVESFIKSCADATDATLIMSKVVKRVSAQITKDLASKLMSSSVSAEQKRLDEARKALLGTLSGISKELSNEQNRQQNAPRANYVDQMIKDQERQSKILSEQTKDMGQLFKEQEALQAEYLKYQAEFAERLDRTQNKYNASSKGVVNVDAPSAETRWGEFADFGSLLAEQKRMQKAADKYNSEFAERLERTQNKYNAGVKGQVNVDAPSYEAHRDRHREDFTRLLNERDDLLKAQAQQQSSTPNVLDRMIEFQKQKASELKRNVQDMGRLFDEQERAQREFAEKLDRTQNRNNAGIGGKINVADPSKSARESALVFKEMFKQQDKAVREDARVKMGATQANDRLSQSLSRMKNKLSETTAKANSCESSFRKLEKTSHLLKRAFRLVAYSMIGKALGYAAKQSISFFENLNLFNVAMGKSVDEGKKFVDQMAEVYGMDPSNLYRHAGYFYQLADAIDMPQKSAAKMSLTLTKASNDIASLFNMPIERVTEDMASGMQGMTRAIRKYGMDIRVATLQQTAMNLGISQQISTMSEADRQGLRYITMMQQASNATKQFTIDENGNKVATGDFAKTIEQPANQLRILKEQLAQLGRAIGDLFIVPLSRAIQYVNAFVMALRMIITYIGAFFPKLKDTETTFAGTADKAKDAAGAISGVGNAAQKAAKKVNSMLAPFDELNVLQDKTSSGGGGGVGGIGENLGLNPEIAKAIEDMELKIENVKMKAVLARDALLQFLGFELDGNQIVGWDFDTLLANLQQLEQTITAKFPEWATYVGILGGAFVALHSPLNRVFNFFSHPSYALVKKLFDILQNGASYTVPVFGGALERAAGKVSGLMSVLGKLVNIFAPQLVNFFAGVAVAGAAVFIGGFIEWMASSDEFRGHLAKWKDSLGVIFGNLKDLIMAAFRAIKNAIHYCATNFDWLYDSIANIVTGILQVLEGITEFIAGVFTGDWKRAWRGVAKIFEGTFRGVLSVVRVVVNTISGLINGLISGIEWAVNAVISGVKSLTFDVPSWVPFVGGKHFGPFDNLSQVSLGRVPKMAKGGVITAPTMAMIGEGAYDEAVIPLGNSPQMSELVDRIVDATSRKDDTPIQVCVYIGDEQIAEYMHRADRRYMLQTNGGV